VRAGLIAASMPAVSLLAACGGGGSGAAGAKVPVGATLADLIKGSKAEGGQVVLYGVETDFANAVGAKFQQAYPWTKVSTVPLSPSDLISKLLSEARANAKTADVAYLTPSQPAVLRTSKILAKIDIPNSHLVPSKWLDPTEVSLPGYSNLMCLGYNTNLLKTAPLDDLYELGDPKWKGQIAMDNLQNIGAAAMFLAGQRKFMGDDKWKDWLGKLAKNDILFTSDGGAAYQAVLTGERSLAPCSYGDISTQAKGAPVAPVWYDHMPPWVEYTVMPSGAPHPFSALLFLNWTVSDEGQRAISTTQGKTPVLDIDVPMAASNVVPADRMDQLSTPGDVKQYTDDPESYLKIFSQYWPAS
jgi:ABC-type Fe3+ transport system substrate-binding protein